MFVLGIYWGIFMFLLESTQIVTEHVTKSHTSSIFYWERRSPYIQDHVKFGQVYYIICSY